MPELPEVETVARQLAPLVQGRRVRSLRIHDTARLAVDRGGRLRGATIGVVRRLGKRVLFELSRPRGGPLYLAVHLRMTGRLVWRADAPPLDPLTDKHLRADIATDGGVIDFVDPRRFGTFELSDDLAALEPAGVDPTSRALTAKRLEALIAGSKQAIKVWLLRQDRLVGLGNIYACEILHRARIDPRRPARSLTAAEREALVPATKQVLRQAIEACGTTFSDFQDAYGLTGSFQAYLAVYAREGEACGTCGAVIERFVQAQRSTFHCPGCQR